MINLFVQDVLDALHEQCIKKIKKVAKHVRSSPQHHQEWENAENMLEIKPVKFIELNVKTRWNSTYRMIRDAI